jgi:glyoxylase-like metal-dependent hydrolase (beta-lactamase superfamily II)
MVVGEERMVLFDCVATPFLRLEQAGLDSNYLTDLIVTHFHPDRFSGGEFWFVGALKIETNFPIFKVGKFVFQFALLGQIANSRVTRSK